MLLERLFDDVVEQIDSHIADVVQKLIESLAEQRRLINYQKQDSDEAKFISNPDYQQLIEELLHTDFGEVSSPNQHDCIYNNAKVVAVVSGEHLLGSRLIRPATSTLLTKRRRFLVQHSDYFSILTPEAVFEQTLTIETSACRRSGTGLRFLADDLATGNPVFVDQQVIKTVELDAASDKFVQAVTRIDLNSFDSEPLGLAVFDGKLYTACRGDILIFSLKTWEKLRTQQISRFSNAGFMANVLAIHKGSLYFSGNGGRTLFRVPLNEANGELWMEECSRVASGFSCLRAVCFDEDGFIIVANKGHGLIQVLSPDGEIMASFSPPNSMGPFRPLDVSIIQARAGEVFSFKNDILCKTVIVSPDYSANRVVFFGIPT